MHCAGPANTWSSRCYTLINSTCSATENPCFVDVSCHDLQNQQKSYCDTCPAGFQGDGITCEKGGPWKPLQGISIRLNERFFTPSKSQPYDQSGCTLPATSHSCMTGQTSRNWYYLVI